MANDCSECCEELQCEVDALKSNQTELFGRTNQIKGYLEELAEVHMYTLVRSEAELTDALAQGGLIALNGDIVLSGPAIIARPNTVLFSVPSQDGFKAQLVLPYQLGFNQAVIEVAAPDVSIINIGITTENPLTETTTLDHGIWISDAVDADVSRLKVIDCDIYRVAYGITRSGDSFNYNTPNAKDITIFRNRIRDFSRGGIYFTAKTSDINIILNTIRGRETSTTHATVWNGIWLGNKADRAIIGFNRIDKIGRHGIEYWNDQTSPETVDGNQLCLIIGNIITGPISGMSGVGNFGISAFGSESIKIAQNSVYGAWNIGIEIYNDPVNTGKVSVTENFVKGYTAQGISVNDTVGSLIEANEVGPSIGLTADEYGVQIIHGGYNVTVQKNNFIDAGSIAIFINGSARSITATDTSTIAGHTMFTVSVAFPTSGNDWYTGKKVYVRDLNGDASFSACEGFFDITLRNADGSEWQSGDPAATRFSIPVDSSAFPGSDPTSGVLQLRHHVISVKDNKAVLNDQRPNFAGNNYMMIGYEFQTILVKDNEGWYSDDVTAYGGIQVWNSRGEVYDEHGADAPITVGAVTNITGSNTQVQFEI